MNIFTGSYKKSTAGIACALGIFFVSASTYSNAAETASSHSVAISSSAASVSDNVVVDNHALENNNSAVQPPVNASSINAPATTTPATTAPAITATKPMPPQPGSSASQVASILGGLILIVALIYGLSWFAKRFSQGGFMQNPSMKVVSAMPLGTRERLMLVDVGGKQLLLGVTATQINTLHVFDEPVVVAAEKSQPIVSDFSQKLMAILQNKNVVSPNDTAPKNSNL
jgi:flagellar protein FliO/FliZ